MGEDEHLRRIRSIQPSINFVARQKDLRTEHAAAQE